MAPVSVDATTSVLPPSTSTRRSLWSDPAHKRELESGAQTIDDLSQSTSLNFVGDLPSSSEIQTSWRPVRSETNAIHLPFGDQRTSWSRHGDSETRCGSPR